MLEQLKNKLGELSAPPLYLVEAKSKGKTKGSLPVFQTEQEILDYAQPIKSNREKTLFEMCRLLHHRYDYDEEALREFAYQTNERLCNPPLAEDEVKKAIQSGLKYPPKRLNCDNDLPNIIVKGCHLREISEKAIQAIVDHNPDEHPIFRRGTTLCRIRWGRQGEPLLEALNEFSLRWHAERCANWFTVSKAGETPVNPPKEAIQDMLSAPDWPLPYILGVAKAPVYSPEGNLITTPGYNPTTHYWLHLGGDLDIPGVPDTPTQEDVSKAVNILLGTYLGDFPFKDQASKAHMLAALILPAVMLMIKGPKPLFLIDASTPGSGKSLLTKLIGIPYSGCPPVVMSPGDNDEEWRKRITAFLLQGHSIAVIDNVRHRIDASPLAAVLTADTWEDRILGKTEMVHLPVNACWLATGNNLQLSNEISRRSVWIRLSPDREDPWRKEEFKIPNILEWAKANRGHILWAIYTIIQNWIAQGKPEGGKVIGSFECWSRTTGGILECASVEGFLGNIEELFSQAEDELSPWREFVEAWWEKYGADSVPTPELFSLAHSNGYLQEVRGGGHDQSQRTRLGRALTKYHERIVGPFKILKSVKPDRKGSGQYRLAPMGEPPEPEKFTGWEFTT